MEMGIHIPEPPFQVDILDEHNSIVTNPFSGESCVLNPVATAVYYSIKGAEMFGQYEIVQAGLSWFKEHYAKEYMVLLD